MSSKTYASPAIAKALGWIKMTVENALPDCGRQRLQWQSPPPAAFR
jgi:hypothetical protein